ncbi:MAG TPA: aldehyde dehydrogenase family protein [Tepidisphaeraceae bacterium]|nr:aldehyde dehydrogenase family protein [Tepidisphaeraceae bacterium]
MNLLNDLFGSPSSTQAGTWVGRSSLPTAGPLCGIRSPIDGKTLVNVSLTITQQLDSAVQSAAQAFKVWRTTPAPRRGEFVRLIGEALRKHKSDLAKIVSLEAGKITSEALGEVQEMIDICDFAVGLSRQLHGLTMASERPGHRMMEQWHPLGPVGVITAFNFPVAVWAWNAMLALVCGDPVIWKPSEKTPLCAIATHQIVADVMREMPEIPDGVASVLIGDAKTVGQPLAAQRDLPLISATGSVKMGQQVAQTVAARLGRSLLELGGNNGMILTPSADLELAIRAITFAAAGTCGQRCTTLRRLIVHNNIRENVVKRLTSVFAKLKVGNPLEDGVLVGPLIDEHAFIAMAQAIDRAKQDGGTVHGGERITQNVPTGGFYVRPAIIEMPKQSPLVCEETFAPILYVMGYDNLQQAIDMHNDVPQGLSSAIFTNNVREAEIFLSPAGSDCGIANVNIGTSGAEIGGAFGGEKQTGGGRESGSDAWKNYMRRTTNTVNYSDQLPLAQGVSFDV